MTTIAVLPSSSSANDNHDNVETSQGQYSTGGLPQQHSQEIPQGQYAISGVPQYTISSIPQQYSQDIPQAQYTISGIGNYNNQDIPTAIATAVPVHHGWASPRTWNTNNWNNHVLPDCDDEGSLTERQVFLVGVHRITKLIRVISFVEIALIVIIGIVLPVYFIVLPFPFCGYFGARRYSSRLLYCYLFYIALNFIGGIISVFFIVNLFYIIFRLIYLAVNVTVFRYIFRLCGFINGFSNDDYDFVFNSRVIQNIDRSTMC